MKGKHPLWTLRTKAEAQEFWETAFPTAQAQTAEGIVTENQSSKDEMPLQKDKTIKKGVV